MKQLSEQELQLLRKKPDFYMTDEELALFEDDEKWQSEEREYYSSDEYTESLEYDDNFFDRYPECPRPKHIHRFDWVISKQIAMDIDNGQRECVVEPYMPELDATLIDSKAESFYNWALKNHVEEAVNNHNIIYSDDVSIETIHFHDKDNTWHLDVDCDYNGHLIATSEAVDEKRDSIGLRDLDDIVRILDKARIPEEGRPMFFYFHVEAIISTNLKKTNDPDNKPVPDNEPDHLKAWMKQWL